MNKYYLGGDVSKGYCHFILLDEYMNIKIKAFRLDDTPKGHESLFLKLKNKMDAEDYIIYSGLESTGGYEDHWYKAIEKFSPALNIKISRINPSRVYESDKILNNKIKIDKSSSLSIAKYLIRFIDKVDFEISDSWKDIKKQWTFLRLLKTQKTQLKNHLESLTYKYNPGYTQFLSRGISNWLLDFLIKYPTSLKVKNSKLQGLTNIKYITKERAIKIKAIAKEYYVETPNEIGEIISVICKQIKSKDELLKKQLRVIEGQISQSNIEILTSFKGIDRLSAIGLLIQFGDLNRFSSKQQVVGFFGTHPTFRSSGDKNGRGRMSKAGIPEAKRLLYMISLSAIRWNNDIRHFYLRKKIEGKPSMVALGACMNKSLRIIYSMLKHKTKFIPVHTKEHVEKLECKYNELVKTKNINKLKEKYELGKSKNDFFKNAPISSRERKMRFDYTNIDEDIETKSSN